LEKLIDLDGIGFYTLSNERAKNSSASSPLWRCELILTGRCNFRCPYCRSVGGQDLPFPDARDTVALWASQGLRNIRFSGGEPTLYEKLPQLVSFSRALGIERIAISTNGSADAIVYEDLRLRGVNDFSISLDACCSEDGDRMAGGRKGSFEKVVENIRALAGKTYVTVGVVLTADNQFATEEIIKFADGLGVSDIRVIPAAQHGERLPALSVDKNLLDKYPILRYRVTNLAAGKPVRGVPDSGPESCGLVLDDMAVMGEWNYPCIIYLREGGKPIGRVGPDMRSDRAAWYASHNSFADPICSANCLDVCCDYNNAHAKEHR
jgi:MoaA/NifB/PqqE/SkfB family radical SAM enzyme